MTESQLRPTRLLHLAATVAPWCLGLVATAWLLVALAWGLLHGIIVPRIDEFRPRLEAEASRVVGMPVRIARLSAKSDGLVPLFEAEEVVLQDEQGRPAVRLPKVTMALSPASVWRRGFTQLVVDGLELDVRREADGRILVGGKALTKGDGTDVNDSGDNPAMDWLFEQTEVVVRQGTLRWTDAQRDLPPVALTQIDLTLRNRGRSHLVRLDATPPAEWGDRMSLVGRLRQPLLALHNGRWREWDGALYADLPRLNAQHLHRYADLSSDVAQGHGALRLWADVRQGQIAAVTADVALANVNARLDSTLEPLDLPSLEGRLGWRQIAGGFEFSTEGLRFTAADGLQWPGGNVFVRSVGGAGVTGSAAAADTSGIAPEGQFRGDHLELAALAQIAERLPLSDGVHGTLAHLGPKGLLESIDARWQGRPEASATYAVKGRVTGLEVAAEVLSPEAQAGFHTGRPGIRGATVDFDLTQAGGKLTLGMQNGSLTFPGVFEEPEVPLDTLSGDVSWQLDGEKMAVTVGRMQFANADAAGNLQAKWRTSEPPRAGASSGTGGAGDASGSGSASRFPGVLELDGVLDRGLGPRVHRYLPLGVNADARHYVRDAVTGGGATNIRFRVKGDLHEFPYTDARRGEFHISADVKDATFAYVPQSINPAGRPPWPVLSHLSGNLIFDRNGMQIKGASGRLGPNGAIVVPKVEADIADFHHSVVRVTADANGRLSDMLNIVRGSPLNAITQRALEQASATGNGQLQLNLTLPIADIDNSKVQGSVTLAGNDVSLMPGMPSLARTKGVVAFSETGLNITGGQARFLGGDVFFEGGSPSVRAAAGSASKPAGAVPAASAAAGAGGANEPSMTFRINGTATVDGLRQVREVEGLAALTNQMSGSTTYAAQLGIRRGTAEITLNSSLQGLALRLPAPLAKTAESTLPLRVERVLLPPTGSTVAPGPEHDRISVSLGKVASAQYVRDLSGSSVRVLRGAVGLGDRADGTLPLPEAGVTAQIAVDALDTDAWESAFSAPASPAATASAPSAAPANPSTPNAANLVSEYLPTRIGLRTKTLTFSGRALHDLSLDATHDGQVWRANINATEVSGNGEYRSSADGNPGRLYARLAKLRLGSTDAGGHGNTGPTETVLDNATRSVPALDVVVEDFQLQGNKLGRLELEAVNRAANLAQRDAGNGSNNEWRLNRLVLSNPEATFTASGNWSALNAQPGARRTVLNFKLDVADGGKLLERFEMPGVFRKGKGQMDGQIAWVGAPTALDYATLVGQLNVNLEDGQFLKADPGLAKLLGVLSLQALPRRLTLDFSDIFSAGFAFDFIRGDVKIDRGIAATNNLQMKGVNAAVLMDGRVDLAKETQDLKVVVIPEISAGTAALAVSVINPAIGLGTFLAQMFLSKPLMEAATQVFHIDGTWVDPKITKVNRKSLWSGEPAAGAQDPAKDNTRNGASR